MPVSTPQSAAADSSPARGALGRAVRPSLFVSYNGAIPSRPYGVTTIASVRNALSAATRRLLFGGYFHNGVGHGREHAVVQP